MRILTQAFLGLSLTMVLGCLGHGRGLFGIVGIVIIHRVDRGEDLGLVAEF